MKNSFAPPPGFTLWGDAGGCRPSQTGPEVQPGRLSDAAAAATPPRLQPLTDWS